MHRVPLIKDSKQLECVIQETEELIRIFVASIKTAEKKDRIPDSTFGVRCSAFTAHCLLIICHFVVEIHDLSTI